MIEYDYSKMLPVNFFQISSHWKQRMNAFIKVECNKKVYEINLIEFNQNLNE